MNVRAVLSCRVHLYTVFRHIEANYCNREISQLFNSSALLTPGLISNNSLLAFLHFSKAKLTQWFFFTTMRANPGRLTPIIAMRLNNRSIIIFCHHYQPFCKNKNHSSIIPRIQFTQPITVDERRK